jgi:adenylate cyclase
MERKLTAILCADVFGYSRLMGENEEATLRTLSSHRKLIDSLIEQHHGRFVNSAGDSVLAEFASVVNAVQCAVEIQTTLKAENASLPPERRMEFRHACDCRADADLGQGPAKAAGYRPAHNCP